MIAHIVKRSEWEYGVARGRYAPASLRAEGFIHCSTLAQVVDTANRFYRGEKGLVVLWIDERRVAAELKYEASAAGVTPAPSIRAALRCRVRPLPRQAAANREAAAGEMFPHLYGELNADAVVRVVEFPCEADGSFRLPDEMRG